MARSGMTEWVVSAGPSELPLKALSFWEPPPTPALRATSPIKGEEDNQPLNDEVFLP
jgi:hypothetical protein